ncbi:MAG: hypothetical protein QOJ16_4954 [Acidobacteriota bacterium]|nr:hypothetical protein [Acidobacteriota bacterium]
MRVRPYAILVFVILAAPASWAQAGPPALPDINSLACGDGTTADEKADLTIDASASKGPDNRCFDSRSILRVKLIHKNPFYFKYALQEDDKVIAETSIADFFKALTGSEFIKLPDAGAEAKQGQKTCGKSCQACRAHLHATKNLQR